jgi:[amino group carrier protein]-L-2-aminoadipate 6-kinase
MLIIKVGGGENINKAGIAEDIKKLKEPVVFVHGGRKQTDKVADALGRPTKRIQSPSGVTSVLTDKEALKTLTMVYAGLLNKEWVQVFQKQQVNAVGLSGADGRIWQGERKMNLIAAENGKEKLVKDTYTGKVNKINAGLINLLLENNYLPVITQPAITEDGELINTDNDRNLGVMAGALGAKKLVVLFEAPGMLESPEDESTVIRFIKKSELKNMMQFAKGMMKKKIIGAIEAFAAGAEEICWGDSRIENPVTSALEGKGTTIS